jgi:hypothetical protein
VINCVRRINTTKYIAKANLKQAFTACLHVIHFGVCLVWLIGVSS